MKMCNINNFIKTGAITFLQPLAYQVAIKQNGITIDYNHNLKCSDCEISKETRVSLKGEKIEYSNNRGE